MNKQKKENEISEEVSSADEAFFNGGLMNGEIGELEHYFWRYEYQDRGAPHIHMKLDKIRANKWRNY
jgi:hypothetical protein